MKNKPENLSVSIRSAEIKDVESIIKLSKRCDLYDEHIDNPVKIKRKITRDSDGLLVAVESKYQKVIGSASIIDDGRIAYMYRIAVDPDFRGKGIGTKLVKEGVKRLKNRGTDEIIVFVNELNKGLQKNFYEKSLGFLFEDTYRCMYIDF